MPGPALNLSTLPVLQGADVLHTFAKCRVHAFGADLEATTYWGGYWMCATFSYRLLISPLLVQEAATFFRKRPGGKCSQLCRPTRLSHDKSMVPLEQKSWPRQHSVGSSSCIPKKTPKIIYRKQATIWIESWGTVCQPCAGTRVSKIPSASPSAAEKDRKQPPRPLW